MEILHYSLKNKSKYRYSRRQHNDDYPIFHKIKYYAMIEYFLFHKSPPLLDDANLLRNVKLTPYNIIGHFKHIIFSKLGLYILLFFYSWINNPSSWMSISV